MSDRPRETVRIARRDKAISGDRGPTVRNAPVEETELELVTTAWSSRASSNVEIIDDEDLMAAGFSPYDNAWRVRLRRGSQITTAMLTAPTSIGQNGPDYATDRQNRPYRDVG